MMQEQLYIDNLEINFDSLTHRYYWKDGKCIDNVTNIIKYSYPSFYKSNLKANIGKNLHRHIYNAINKNLDFDRKDYDQGVIDKFKQFAQNNKILLTEEIVYNRQYKYVGTIDLLMIIDGIKYVIDIKTGMKNKTHKIQIAAYTLALREMQKDENIKMGLLYINSDKWVFNKFTGVEYLEYKNEFLNCLKIYKENKKNE